MMKCQLHHRPPFQLTKNFPFVRGKSIRLESINSRLDDNSPSDQLTVEKSQLGSLSRTLVAA